MALSAYVPVVVLCFYVLVEKVGQVDVDVSMGGEMLCPSVSFPMLNLLPCGCGVLAHGVSIATLLMDPRGGIPTSVQFPSNPAGVSPALSQLS